MKKEFKIFILLTLICVTSFLLMGALVEVVNYVVGGADVAVTDGGTAKSAWTQYLIPYADTTTSFSQIPIGTAGQVLTSNGAGSVSSFQDVAGGFTPAYISYGMAGSSSIIQATVTTAGTYYKMVVIAGTAYTYSSSNISAGDVKFTTEVAGLFEVRIDGDFITDTAGIGKIRYYKDGVYINGSEISEVYLATTTKRYSFTTYLTLTANSYIEFYVTHATSGKYLRIMNPQIVIKKISD